MQVIIHALCVGIAFLSVFIPVHPSTVYHIVPTTLQISNCSHCITLSQFANDPTRYASSNTTTLKVARGYHSLNKDIRVSDTEQFLILPMQKDTNSTPEIVCNNSCFAFTNISNVKLSGLKLIGCTGNRIEHVNKAVLESSTIEGKNDSKSLLTIAESNVSIVSVSFLSNAVRKSEYNSKEFKMASASVVGTVGGALTVTHSNLEIYNSFFEKNIANIGGAIFSEAESSITINSTTFTSNYAASSNRGPCSGGALFISEQSTVIIQNCNFHNNTSEGYGGVAGVFNATLSISCSYADNSASKIYGGAVATFLSISLEINCTKFNDSKTNIYGGALYLYTSNATISSSHFVNNTAGVFGGAIATWEGTSSIVVNIDECKFSHNSAGKSGAVLYSHTNKNIIIINSTFTFNKANLYGVLMADNESSIDLQSSTFKRNEIGDDGGAIFLDSKSNAVIKSSKFSNNRANDTGGAISARRGSTIVAIHSLFNACKADYGGGIYVKVDSNIIIVNSTFINNTAKFGGALGVGVRGIIVIKNSKFENNSAKIDGGVLNSRTNNKFSISNCTFIANSADNDGVFLIYDMSSILLENSTFISNKAENNGGVVYVFDRSNATINDCQFTNNSARVCGGVLYVRKSSNISIANSQFVSCTTDSGGVLYAQFDSMAYINTSNFTTNEAGNGGAIALEFRSRSKIVNSLFNDNQARLRGGVVTANGGSIMQFQTCNFTSNRALFGGAIHAIQNCTLTFENSWFLYNKAFDVGGVFTLVLRNHLNVTRSTMQYNQANNGGVLHVTGSNIITVDFSLFDHNYANYSGGCMYVKDESIIGVNNSTFFSNTAKNDGGVMTSSAKSTTHIDSSIFTKNEAGDRGGVFCLQMSSINIHSSAFDLSAVGNRGETAYTSNVSFKIGGTITDCLMKVGGVLYLDDNSNVFIAQSNFTRNRADNCGGVVMISSSSIVVVDSNFYSNNATRGAAMAILNSSSVLNTTFVCLDYTGEKLTVECREYEIQITDNRAKVGGGIYLSDGKICFESITRFNHNQATNFGGGIFAIHSSITIGRTVTFYGNHAERGGGISLMHSMLSGNTIASDNRENYVKFLSNTANKGGAVYVEDDEEENTMCYNNPYAAIYKGGCFFQNVSNNLKMNFTNNYANVSGHNLYGGLLDRCAIINWKNAHNSESNGVTRLKEISNIINLNTVSSPPVRVCLCRDRTPDCNQVTHSVQVKIGNTFPITIVAVDQVRLPTNSTVHSFSLDLPEAKKIQTIGNRCTLLDYKISFPKADTEYKLTIYPEGPCSNKGISVFNITIHVLSCLCPPGFRKTDNNNECACTCDKWLTSFIKVCDSNGSTVQREGTFWITYLGDSNDSSSPYFIYPYCPFDYCQPPTMSVPINLSLPNGSDTQCANNRGGFLCGGCLPGYSLSLGSSKCVKCHNHSQELVVVMLLVFSLAGIALVALLLLLNLTTAVGTLNSIIFYANIIDASSSIYFTNSNLMFVFISWLNLNVGFNMCFFDRMDAYTKTWLQLAFPTYVIFLIIITIITSAYSSRFSKLIGRRNPVATLATLLLLSYTKLVETNILSFSSASIRFPNDTTIVKWLPDANIDYGKGKHIGLLFAGTIVLVIGLPYTVFIFSWQWLIRCRKFKIFRNLKIHLFIDAYHSPHSAKHRYWTGLLLITRIIIFLISTSSLSADPRITLLCTLVIVSCLQLYKTMFKIRVYKNSLLNAMETFVLFNIAVFTAITWYTFDNKKMEVLQATASYLSVGTIAALCLVIICFHIYRY